MGKRRESMRDRLQLDSGRLLHVWCSTAEAVEAFAMEELLLGLRKLGLSARKHRACRARRHEIAMGLSSKVASLASPGAPIGAQGYRVDAAPGDIVMRRRRRRAALRRLRTAGGTGRSLRGPGRRRHRRSDRRGRPRR